MSAFITPRAALEAICFADEPRTWMHQPFVAAGMQVASNGHVAIAIPQATPCDDTTGIAKTMPELLAKAAATAAATDRKWTRLDSITLPDRLACHACDGRGHSHETKCPDCDGIGDFDHGSHTYNCKECSGNGFSTSSRPTTPNQAVTKCWHCAGTGEHPRPAAAMGTHFGSHCLRLLARLPNCEITPPEHPLAPTFCRFDGGIAIVKPRRAD